MDGFGDDEDLFDDELDKDAARMDFHKEERDANHSVLDSTLCEEDELDEENYDGFYDSRKNPPAADSDQ